MNAFRIDQLFDFALEIDFFIFLSAWYWAIFRECILGLVPNKHQISNYKARAINI